MLGRSLQGRIMLAVWASLTGQKLPVFASFLALFQMWMKLRHSTSAFKMCLSIAVAGDPLITASLWKAQATSSRKPLLMVSITDEAERVLSSYLLVVMGLQPAINATLTDTRIVSILLQSLPSILKGFIPIIQSLVRPI